MKILLNLLAANQGGQVTRAREFLKKFKSHAHKNDSLIVLISDKLPFKIKNVRSITKLLLKRLNILPKKLHRF